MKHLGQRIKAIREARGLSLNELARRSGVGAASVSRVENEHQTIRVDTLEALVKALGMSLPEFFGADIAALPRGVQIPLLCLAQVPGFVDKTMDAWESTLPMIEVPDMPGATRFLALRIHDVSMQGQRDYFAPGDIVIIDPDTVPDPGDYVLALVDDEAVFRQYKLRQDHIELAPLNPYWPTVSADRTAVVLVGTMVEHRRYRKAEANSLMRYAAYSKS